jgi:hypothetical protein
MPLFRRIPAASIFRIEILRGVIDQTTIIFIVLYVIHQVLEESVEKQITVRQEAGKEPRFPGYDALSNGDISVSQPGNRRTSVGFPRDIVE